MSTYGCGTEASERKCLVSVSTGECFRKRTGNSVGLLKHSEDGTCK